MVFPYTFGSLSGLVPGSYLDANFAACAFAADLTALSATVAALPASATPLKPLAGGLAGVGATLSRTDHQHPPQSAAPNLQTGTTYTLQTTDDGGVVDLANVSAITLTLPNSAAVGFSCLVIQSMAGQVTLAAAGGATLRQRQGFSKLAGQWAMVTALVRTNSGGTSAEWVVGGDMIA